MKNKKIGDLNKTDINTLRYKEAGIRFLTEKGLDPDTFLEVEDKKRRAPYPTKKLKGRVLPYEFGRLK